MKLKFTCYYCLAALTSCLILEVQASEDQSGTTAPKWIYHENTAEGEAMLMRNEALEVYRTSYKDAQFHKAIAQSDSGHWAWSFNKASPEHAINSANIACQSFNKEHEIHYPCKVINVDGKWVE